MIGIVGGLGVGAGIHYYRELAAAHDAIGKPLELVMIHAQMTRIFEHAATGDAPGLARYLEDVIGQLKRGGATIAAIPAVTPHLCIGELLSITPLPIVNMLEAIANEVRARSLSRVALFGTRFVVEGRMFGQLPGVEVVTPRPEEVDYIHHTYFSIASSGAGSEEQRRGLTALARTLCARDGVDAVLLAGTDLSAIFNEGNTDFPHLDCARVHIQAIMRAVT
ncbi:MAG: aspartate/glutamate racemase family protein [Vicinamibacterales bacterium]